MFHAVWAWVVGIWKALLKRCIKQWYLVETKTDAHNDWGEYYPVHCSSLRSAKQYLVATTDTYFWVKCRILDPDGNVADESVANDFYDAPLDIVYMYVETDMRCADVVAAWRKQELRKMDSRESSDVS